MTQILWDFETQKYHLMSVWRPDIVLIYKKKATFLLVEFAVQADHRVKTKENEKLDKCLNFTRQLKRYETWKWKGCRL